MMAAELGSSWILGTSLTLRLTIRWSPSLVSSTLPKPDYPHSHSSLLTDVPIYALIILWIVLHMPD